MALSLTRANRILQKVGIDSTIRPATRAEQRTNGYGEKDCYVFDRGEWQAARGYHTIQDAIAAALEAGWEFYDGAALTEAERRELRAIPSNVAGMI